MTLRAERAGWERSATVIDLHIAGAGVETDEPLQAGERITIAFPTPTRWDPLVLTAVVAWAHPLKPKNELPRPAFGGSAATTDKSLVDALGRPRWTARAGLAFDYPTPDATFAMYELLLAIGFE